MALPWHLENERCGSVHCEEAAPIQRKWRSAGDLASFAHDASLDVDQQTGLKIVARRTFYELDAEAPTDTQSELDSTLKSSSLRQLRWADIEFETDGASTGCPDTDENSDTEPWSRALCCTEHVVSEGVSDTGVGRAFEAQETSCSTRRSRNRRPNARKHRAHYGNLKAAWNVEERACHEIGEPIHQEGELRTTLMLKNVPATCTSAALAETLSWHGFSGYFRFVYVPADFQTWMAIGYAIVDWVSHEAAVHAMDLLQGFTLSEGAPGLLVSWNAPHQGLSVQIAKYRNSPVAHVSVPDQLKPMLFLNGVQQPFPAPTMWIKAPRIRPRHTEA